MKPKFKILVSDISKLVKIVNLGLDFGNTVN